MLIPADPSNIPTEPPDPLRLFDFSYYWDFFLGLPSVYRLGLVALAAALYYAIRSQR